MKRINLPSDLQKAISQPPHIIGVSPNAFSRMVPASFLENYSIVCLKWRGETQYAQKDADVFCIEKMYPDYELPKQSTLGILKIPQVVNYLSKFDDFWLIVYKAMPELEKYCQRKGWKLIVNKYKLRELLENKKNFREILTKSGANPIAGETYMVESFTSGFYDTLVAKFGNDLVFQIAEMTEGGGLGTSFIRSSMDYHNFLLKLPELMVKNPKIVHINVTKFIEGIPASIISVATSQGTITGTLQAQIQDISLVNNPAKGSGLYCGHDFTFLSGKDQLLAKAKKMAKKFGDYINKEYGYRGLFGMDVLVDLEAQEVYPVECNPRYTDLFPIISMNCLATGLVPLDVYHILEFINPGYVLDAGKISLDYKYLTPCSQLVLSTKTNNPTKMEGELKAGVYEFDSYGNIKFVRGGYRFEDLENENEFLITEGVPSKGFVFSYESRICRLVFRRGVLESKNKLTEISSKVIENIYNMIDLRSL